MSRFRTAPVLFSLVGAALTGCATYRREPLPERAVLNSSITVPAAALEKSGTGYHAIDPDAPLDEETIAAIAVLNNPDLIAHRLKAGVAEAQAFEAGLLPDPQVSVGLSRSSEHSGYDIGLAQELQSILTRQAHLAAARGHTRQINLEVLWQESQVAEKARELFIQLSAEPRLLELLTASRRVLAKRYARDNAAMIQDAATAATVATDLTALSGIDTQLRALALQTNDADHALHSLLGLQPNVAIHLGQTEVTALPTRSEFDQMMATLPQRRADLLALRAGYESQEESVRAAILGQFPALSVSVDHARSAEEGVATVGLGVRVSLPIFNRNRGRIAVERATRQQLQAEFQARVAQAVNDADRLRRSIELLEVQHRSVSARVAEIRQSAEAANRQFQAGNLTLDQYADLLPNLYAQEISAIRLRMALAQAEAALRLIAAIGAANDLPPPPED